MQPRSLFFVWLAGFFLLAGSASAQSGSIRGVLRDPTFEIPLARVRVRNVETQTIVESDSRGNYIFPQLAPGTYTLIFDKSGYSQVVRTDVIVAAGQLTDLDVDLSADFVELEDFVVEDVLGIGTGTEAELLQLRIESPSLVSAISAELINRAGASDAAAALKLVSGATIQDGKFPVIRGLPDRYVSSQVNGVRLPSADAETRAVELDQFPSTVIQSIQVSKTFTPDQQGDASGGAVNLDLRGIPEESFVRLSTGLGYNTLAGGTSDFLSYEGGGIRDLGKDDGRRDQQLENLGGNWDGAVGVLREDAPVDSKYSLSAGTSTELGDGWRVGGSGSLFYERDSTHFEGGVDDTLEVDTPGTGLNPAITQGSIGIGEFNTNLFDIDRSSQSVQWGSLMTLGAENDNHSLGLSYLYTRAAEDTATLAEDTRGKEFFFPGYDPSDSMGEGNQEPLAAPYLRTETLEYVERTTRTLQLRGEHNLPVDDWELGSVVFKAPVFAWAWANSAADSYTPDKRQFGSLWTGPIFNPGAPPFIPPFTDPANHSVFLPAANINFGNLQRIWQTIEEDSDQLQLSMKLPFEQWDGEEGYWKFGYFADEVERRFDQDTFTNAGDQSNFEGRFDLFWSRFFPDEDHPILASEQDVDYDGFQDITATYGMFDLPITSDFKLIGGARFENMQVGIVNSPEDEVFLFLPNEPAAVEFSSELADVAIDQDDVLPALAMVYEATDTVTLRTSFSRTIARQTFRELSPIIQQEFLGGPVFIGNPELETSSLENYDLRMDWVPYEGGLVSLSYFYKDIENPIEVVERNIDFGFSTPVNYPKGNLSGIEIEGRTDLVRLHDSLEGLGIGANATFIDSEVTLPDDEIAAFNAPDIDAPLSKRDATGAPEKLFNLFLTYDLPDSGTQFGLFYTVQGDTLVTGAAAVNGVFTPSVYARSFDTLNLTFSQRLSDFCQLRIQAKNLTDPAIRQVYRSEYTGDDQLNTKFRRGVDFSVALVFAF